MVNHVLTAPGEIEIHEIAEIFCNECIGTMPIVDKKDQLVGIITRGDILRTFINKAPFELWI